MTARRSLRDRNRAAIALDPETTDVDHPALDTPPEPHSWAHLEHYCGLVAPCGGLARSTAKRTRKSAHRSFRQRHVDPAPPATLTALRWHGANRASLKESVSNPGHGGRGAC